MLGEADVMVTRPAETALRDVHTDVLPAIDMDVCPQGLWFRRASYGAPKRSFSRQNTCGFPLYCISFSMTRERGRDVINATGAHAHTNGALLGGRYYMSTLDTLEISEAWLAVKREIAMAVRTGFKQ